MFRKYILIKQHDLKDCGAACLAMISKHYGLKYPISKIRQISGTDHQGTSAWGVVQAAEKLGFTAKAVKGNQEAFFDNFPLPAIAHVVIDQTLLHYVVIHKISKKEVIVADPGKGIVKYTPEQFFQIWTGILILMVPTPQFKKGDLTKGLFARFFGLLIPQKRMLLGIFLTSILYTVLGILSAFYFQFLIDEILPFGLKKTLNIISAGVIILYIFKILLNAFRSHILLTLSQKLDISLILGYYHHVLKLPMNFFGTRKTGEIISRLMDASKVRDAISSATLTLMIDIIMVMAGAIILYSQSGLLFGVTLLMVPLYLALVWGFHKPFDRLNREQMEKNAQLTSYLVESIDGIETVKAYNAERNVGFETEQKFISFLRSVFSFGIFNNVQGSLKGFVQLIGGVVILWVGASQVLAGKMSMGQLLTYNSLLAYFLDPIQNLINLQPTLQTAVVAADRLGEILDLEAEKHEDEDQKLQPASLKGDIEFCNVSFRYGTRSMVLHDIDLHLHEGEKIAFVGESGSGKTTLIKLIMQFYKHEAGEILINNTNIKDIHLDSLRQRISYISQDTFFFSGTIRDNLCLGMEHETGLEQIIQACETAQAHDFINQLPLRYNTMLEENAANISGGQKQRLAIARAILKHPDILIMDEATSNLDSTTEKAVSETINAFENMTTIIIAHRLSTIMRCDRIYVMEHGRIIEHGTHGDLLNNRGKYYGLWKDQLPGIDSKQEQQIQYAVGIGEV
ncbi:Lactococcin-G-processing and transport ATP-binding protein LagD [Paenibacillus auburnensis]|uniref:Lactococcin-G-processing and transport ATP-binding protein LagD n=1 Tax=Paenibacillus auburnensis TaxID=2905649 RepID=A0ABN8GJT7_9BACL|nr:peptidase domain-containing ABC transporter [Paenibacillus auburnensis]CAH1209382.1 Lactococcin-G-processing and transport ATP-binding protein LagD [Paenibacillus auburnensis]